MFVASESYWLNLMQNTHKEKSLKKKEIEIEIEIEIEKTYDPITSNHLIL